MAASCAVPGFTAVAQGFQFTNSFPPEPSITIDLGPAGHVGVGDASQGLCGGMAYAVRDYFEAGIAIPADTTPPARGTRLFDYIVKRLIDSFNLPSGVAEYAMWMALPGNDLHVLGLDEHGTSHRTVNDSWPAVKADIDAGHPAPLGLVTIHSADVRQIGRCHQVLAYGYSVADTNILTLSIYDPNTPNSRADGVWIRPPLNHPENGVTITHNINIGEPTLHGFFRSHYSPATPPAA